MKLFYSIVLALAAGLTAGAQAPPSTHVNGEVTAVDPGASQITIKTDKGETLTFAIAARTQIYNAKPGVTDPRQWPKMTVSEISVGDKALAAYRGSAEQKPLVATSLVVRTKAELNQMAQSEMADWKKRGTTGIVAAADPAAKTITLKVGMRTVTVQASDKTQFHRYSLDSGKFSDAKPSSLAEVKAGDQVNVLGNKSEDGATITAEVVYAGTFRQIAATIISIDPASGEMKVTDLATKKPLSIRITADTAMRKLPEQMAAMLGRRYQRGQRGGAEAGRQGFSPGEGRGPGEGRAPGAGRGDISAMLDHLPPMQLSELKPKDAIMVSTTMGSDPSKVTAITLLAGVEPVLTAAPNATRDLMSGWSLGGGGGEGGEGQ